MGDSNHRIAATVGLTASAEIRVVIGCLCETVSGCKLYRECRAYPTGVNDTLLEDLSLLASDGRSDCDSGQRTDQGSEGGEPEAGHC